MASIEYVNPVTLARAVADWPDHGQHQAGACGNQHIKMSVAASVGIGVGVAYHFLVDGLVQRAPYDDIPPPFEAHQSVFAVIGLGEAVGFYQKRRS